MTRTGSPTAYRINGGEPARFCSSCQRERPEKGGTTRVAANGVKRWRCADCTAGRSSGLYGRRTA